MYPERFKFELYNGGTRILFPEKAGTLSFFTECYLKVFKPLVELDYDVTIEINYKREIWLNHMTAESLIAFGTVLNKIENEDQLLQTEAEL